MDVIKQRELNIKRRDEFLKECALNDPEFAEALNYLEDLNKENQRGSKKVVTNKPRPKPRSRDPAFTFSGVVPLVQRKSARLSKSKPEYTEADLDDLETKGTATSDEDNLSYLTEKYRNDYPRLRRSTSRTTERPPIIAVEDVTEEMLANISTRVKDKTYSSDGTSCHQCRQKTIDQKTCCRNPNCVGVQGQLCGVCIKNRYGEDAAVALLDPNWTCFVCRGICNCSFCRRKEGKVPTGILVPIAQRNGHSNVDSFLKSLSGDIERDASKGIASDTTSLKIKDPFLGFTEEEIEKAQDTLKKINNMQTSSAKWYRANIKPNYGFEDKNKFTEESHITVSNENLVNGLDTELESTDQVLLGYQNGEAVFNNNSSRKLEDENLAETTV
ncbi:cell division cycle-associated protein 7-like [Aethina tumida]|uniref:cell division cycle-associated protein 7-like n=1 Tax=Aethina tumida TaxID=116153 RepID=UPI0021489FAF|nr:cell division cycle-associated protein 7-like [Aethina tumida]XP_049824763.1 cell division cycle-associated protein 7-like [Aethina tumida]